MKWTDNYYKNRPLFNSILAGALYFLFCWSLDYGDLTKGLFMSLMLFLPGLTFPLTTCYYRTDNIKYSSFHRIIHFVLSVGIYHGSVWLFSAEGQIKYITILAGLLGSLLFQLLTKFILKKEITLTQIALTSLLSGLAFLPYELSERLGIFIGLAVFLWTITNGITLNKEYRKATYR
ncbi:hypothetical protein GCM10022406_15190 [Hymenobacter algoricola]|uniref:HPP family protein n=2 Tax=Hymenobacter algoricola TaxID=486267 RepID=A0ABP7MVD9_9BACT